MNKKSQNELRYLKSVDEMLSLPTDENPKFNTCRRIFEIIGVILLVVGGVLLTKNLTVKVTIACLCTALGGVFIGIAKYMAVINRSWPFLKKHIDKTSLKSRINELETAE